MWRPRSKSRLGGVCAALIVVALALAGCESNGTSTHVSPKAPVHVYRGGTVYFAPLAPADWIFPFLSATHETVQNIQFQYLMYRPLYWFGQIRTPSPSFDEQLSLAHPPTTSNASRTVVIRLKGWKFSDGQGVDAQSVIFWMNMLKAEPNNWGPSSEPNFPYDVTSYSAPDGPGGDLVTITFDKRYSTLWLLYNALSQITPMPEAWDITSLLGSPGSGRCGLVDAGEMNGVATKSACSRVWTFDTDNGETSTSPHMSGDLDTYGSNPLWQVVDGPWRLASYEVSTGDATFVPNLDYSGPQKPIISRFVELVYPSDAALMADLARGDPGSPDVAWISSQDPPVNNGPPGSTGANIPQLRSRFALYLADQWGISYVAENFDSTGEGGVVGALFRQPYIREAMQLLVNQPELIRTAFRGYGVADYGPVPVLPKSPFLSEQEAINPYPFDPARAVLLLKDRGWRVVPEGADICTSPGNGPRDCGNGIKRGSELKFTLLYNNDIWHIQLIVAEISEWAKAGIEVESEGEPHALCSIEPSASCGTVITSWGMVDFGGWAYEPDDYLPTGEELFSPSSSFNVGSYRDDAASRIISETLVSSRLRYVYEYENYLARQLPVVWEPNSAVVPFEISKHLGGVTPINTLYNLTPEYWYWKTPSSS